jgi:predicted RNase H-like HicB family nuclease
MSCFDQHIEDNKDAYSQVKSLDELLQEICYAYEDQYAPIYKDRNGIYYVYKLSIGKNWIQYKQHISYLHPNVYEQMEKFFLIEIEK